MIAGVWSSPKTDLVKKFQPKNWSFENVQCLSQCVVTFKVKVVATSCSYLFYFVKKLCYFLKILKSLIYQICDIMMMSISIKNFCHFFSRFWPFRGWVVWVNPLKKENSWQKSFFQIMLNEVLKICKKWYPVSADVKANIQNKK